MKKIPALLLALFSSALMFAQQSSPAPKPPAPPPPPAESHQFDFWLGEWEVTGPKGKIIGHSRIEQMANGWGLLENWESPGAPGKSLNAWNPAKKCWQQFWVGSGGGILELRGGLDAQGRMVMQGESPNPAGPGTVLNRITWTPNADGTVRQAWDISTDAGATWQLSFDGLYRHPAK